jgi:hypothetical protein
MIRMIANNTSDYVATDLIQQLWCQHHEKYGSHFLDEPHQSKTKCTFEHLKKEEDCNQYASFGKVFNDNQKKNNSTQPHVMFSSKQEYFGIDSNGTIENEKNFMPSFLNDESTILIRKRENNIDNSTKV